jgi:DNA phosphorothioation-dependent restriction protein DptG
MFHNFIQKYKLLDKHTETRFDYIFLITDAKCVRFLKFLHVCQKNIDFRAYFINDSSTTPYFILNLLFAFNQKKYSRIKKRTVS